MRGRSGAALLGTARVLLPRRSRNGHVNVLWEGTLQRAIPPERLSRVSAYDQLGSFCLLPLGYALAGPLALLAGASGALWLGGILILLLTLLLLAMPRVRDAERRAT